MGIEHSYEMTVYRVADRDGMFYSANLNTSIHLAILCLN